MNQCHRTKRNPGLNASRRFEAKRLIVAANQRVRRERRQHFRFGLEHLLGEIVGVGHLGHLGEKAVRGRA